MNHSISKDLANLSNRVIEGSSLDQVAYCREPSVSVHAQLLLADGIPVALCRSGCQIVVVTFLFLEFWVESTGSCDALDHGAYLTGFLASGPLQRRTRVA